MSKNHIRWAGIAVMMLCLVNSVMELSSPEKRNLAIVSAVGSIVYIACMLRLVLRKK
ncbi:hypothetical protein [Klebsiella pneumoniae]|uniref:hypothetical protein n=1 Tax=Klebsiella pneumoniae TaxID=573 RepID=UPI00311F1FC8